VKREITPRQQAEVHRLGIPGVGFLPENKRVYPNAEAAAHVLGFANVDNVGIAGIEKYIDSMGLQDLNGAGFNISAADLKPIQLSIDLRVQHALRDELAKGLAKFKAKATAGVILDVNTGEIVALVSLPDYDPNNPVDALADDKINRINVGVFEMGSTFKALTVAMALDSGKFNINSSLDARAGPALRPLHHRRLPPAAARADGAGGVHPLLEYRHRPHGARHRRRGPQGLPAQDGPARPSQTELPESAAPIVPGRWGEINTVTIAFGHGLAVAPAAGADGGGRLVNGGTLIPPTFLKRTEARPRRRTQVIKPETSEGMRYVMRLNASNPSGSASAAAIAGFFVGGKTGTAEKVINGRYSKTKNLTTFTAVVPADKPRYVFLTIMDEPKATPETYGFSTAGWNAGPVTGNIIERAAPLLGLPPRFEPPQQPFPLMARLGAWGIK
jgi:cell division protein FtsI (penicillin-binding protein 3)